MTSSSGEARDLALSIPHIQESIFRYGGLSSHDLATSSLVNRVWSQTVSPYLWENITISTIDTTPEWLEGFNSGLVSHGKWTRTLTTTSDDIVEWCVPHCTRLLNVDVGSLGKYSIDQNALFKLISRNPELQNLRWNIPRFNFSQQFSSIASGLMTNFGSGSSLTTLYLGRLVIDKSLCKVLNHCSNTLNQLTVFECGVNSETFSGLENPPSHLKRLVLDNNFYYLYNSRSIANQQFPFFLESMTYLVEFTLVTSYLSWIRMAQNALKGIDGKKDGSHGDGYGRPLGSLKALNLRYTGEISFSENVAEQLVESLPDSLIDLTLSGFLFDSSVDLAMSDFMTRNQDGLTSINFILCQDISSETWQIILTSCRFLVEIEGDDSSLLDVTAIRRPWVCLNLERFTMSVELDAGWLESEQSFSWIDGRTLFSQLADLTQLKRLNLSLVAQRLNSRWMHEAKEEFLLWWFEMRTCVKLKEVIATTHFPNMELEATLLERLSREMWGDQVAIRIEVQ